jgi:Phage capsid protein
MSDQIPTAFVQQYGSTIERLVQQKGSRFRAAVRVETQVGKNAFYDQIGAITATQVVARHQDTVITNTPHARRMVSLVDFDVADLIDTFDELRLKIDPTSTMMQNHVDALSRAQDDRIVAAFTGSAFTGETGTTEVTFPTTTQQIASGSTGMTIAKLRNARRLLMAAEVDPDEELYCAISARQHDDLLGLTQVTSTDFNTRPTLVDGRVVRFMGFNFIHSERLLTSGTDRRCPAWARTGMLLSVGKDIATSIDRRPDKRNAIQVYACISVGSTRMQELKVVDILCSEA